MRLKPAIKNRKTGTKKGVRFHVKGYKMMVNEIFQTYLIKMAATVGNMLICIHILKHTTGVAEVRGEK